MATAEEAVYDVLKNAKVELPMLSGYSWTNVVHGVIEAVRNADKAQINPAKAARQVADYYIGPGNYGHTEVAISEAFERFANALEQQ